MSHQPASEKSVIGIIGGSGVYDIAALQDKQWRKIESSFGEPSDECLFGHLDGQPMVFLPRHGRGHKIPPSAINYRANIDALKRAGVTEIYRIGGAQAVAALAWGTGSIAPVDRIVGPGNAYVAEAKRQVFGRVGIDSIAGPSEVVVIADGANDPAHVAMDLLAQAEHDESAQSILITPDAVLADAVAQAVEHALKTLPRAAIAGESWARHGAVILAKDLAEAAALTNRLAPEHLQLMVDDPRGLLSQIRHAGAAFLHDAIIGP
jgi:histidinol dehydrogenase